MLCTLFFLGYVWYPLGEFKKGVQGLFLQKEHRRKGVPAVELNSINVFRGTFTKIQSRKMPSSSNPPNHRAPVRQTADSTQESNLDLHLQHAWDDMTLEERDDEWSSDQYPPLHPISNQDDDDNDQTNRQYLSGLPAVYPSPMRMEHLGEERWPYYHENMGLNLDESPYSVPIPSSRMYHLPDEGLPHHPRSMRLNHDVHPSSRRMEHLPTEWLPYYPPSMRLNQSLPHYFKYYM